MERLNRYVAEYEATTPEPATMLLPSAGLPGMVGYGRRHFNKKA